VTDWLEIVVPAGSSTAEDVAARLCENVEAARSGAELRASDVVFWVPVEDGERVLEETRAAVRQLANSGLALDPAAVRAQPALPEEEWRDAWKRYFHVVRLTRQIVVVPSWESYNERIPHDLVIDLDPGQAFGTGAHSSTRMVLLEMQAARDQGLDVSRFLDLGAGSGILSIAAANLWPGATGVALDIDPVAVDAAKENCDKNRVSGRVLCVDTPISQIDESFDLVLANIQADVLLELREALTARLAPRGWLILSGLLREQIDAVAGRYAEQPELALESTRHAEDESGFSSARLARHSCVSK